MDAGQAGRLEEARQSVTTVRRLQPIFRAAAFGNRFAQPAMRHRIQTALVKAGS